MKKLWDSFGKNGPKHFSQRKKEKKSWKRSNTK